MTMRRFFSPTRATRQCAALATLLTALPALSAFAQTAPSTPFDNAAENRGENRKSKIENTAGEMRGMWVVCDSLSSPASIHQVVVTAKKYNLNTIFVQVRSRGDAWYTSSYEPRAEGLRDQPRDFDPLARIVAEGHREGLQVHAWLNTFLAWSKPRRPLSPDHVWNAHPDWFSHDRKGRLSTANTTDCEGVFLQPSNPDVQQHLFDVFTDVAARYDVDGIHFDYVRYPNETYDFSGATLARFRAYMQTQLDADTARKFDARLKSDPHIYVHAFARQWEEWRRAQVTGLVARIAQAAKANKPWMQVSAAVFPDAKDAAEDRGQDWMNWLRNGTLDSVCLMAYNKNTARVVEQTRRAVAVAGERHVYTGIGAFQLSAHDVAAKIAQVRKAGASGINLFCYDDVHDRSHYLDTLARGVWGSRAGVPPMRWLPARDPVNAPRSGQIDRTGATDRDAPAPTPDK